MILLGGIAFGLMISALTGGRVRDLQNLRLRHEFAIVILFVAQAIFRGRLPYVAEVDWFSVLAWAVAVLVLILLLLADRRRVAVWLISLGLSLNLFVVLANQGMPVATSSPTVLASSAMSGQFYHRATPADVFVVLADVVPAPGGWMVSLGDLLLVVGTSTLVITGCRPDSASPRSH